LFSDAVVDLASGEVWTFGNGLSGQLGHGVLRNEDKPRLVEALLGKSIRALSSGSFHTVAVTGISPIACDSRDLFSSSFVSADLKNAYTWGCGEENQNPSASSAQPRIVESLRAKNITNVACGDSHTVAIAGIASFFFV